MYFWKIGYVWEFFVPDDVYIKWPNRKEVIEKQIKKIVAITRS